MGHLTYEESKKLVVKGLILLGAVTIVEVFLALLGKGYIIKDFHMNYWLIATAMILFSIFKAWWIVTEFMHLKYEVKGLGLSVVLPMLLLVWAIIAFMNEGQFWKNERKLFNPKKDVQFDTSQGSNQLQPPEKEPRIRLI